MFAQALARSARLHRDGMALIAEDESVSWDELGRSVAAVAGALRHAGVNIGDRVAVLAGNSAAHAIAMYAISWAGAVIVPLTPRLSVQEMSRIVAESGAVALFSDAANMQTARGIITSSGNGLVAIAMDAEAAGEQRFAAWRRHPGIEAATAELADLAAIYYTGGTTGAPKGAMLADGALLMQAMSIAGELSIRRGSVVHQAPPLFHLAGAGVAHASALAGATQLFPGKFDAQGLLDLVKAQRATHVSVVPTMLSVLVDLDGITEAFRSVERIVYGSSSITQNVLRKLIAVCPDVQLTQIYGQTECSGPCLFLPPDDHVVAGPRAGRLASAGRPSVYSEIRLVDAEDLPVPPGTAGEITIRAPSVMLGYWKNPDVTRSTLRGGWLHTGDVGIEDEAGYIRIVDRIKDMIVTGGENVFCAEVENVIADHPDVAYCSVIGVPDEKWGERVHAVVGLVRGGTVDAEAIIAHCRSFIAGYKCPKSVEFTAEPLPLSPVGKVRKDVLRTRYLETGGAAA